MGYCRGREPGVLQEVSAWAAVCVYVVIKVQLYGERSSLLSPRRFNCSFKRVSKRSVVHPR